MTVKSSLALMSFGHGMTGIGGDPGWQPNMGLGHRLSGWLTEESEHRMPDHLAEGSSRPLPHANGGQVALRKAVRCRSFVRRAASHRRATLDADGVRRGCSRRKAPPGRRAAVDRSLAAPLAGHSQTRAFYRAAVGIVIDRDGLVDKFGGDEVVAFFASPGRRPAIDR